MSNTELDELCAASCKDPFKDVLSKQPGVLQNKLAHFTGEPCRLGVCLQRNQHGSFMVTRLYKLVLYYLRYSADDDGKTL